MTHEQFIDVVVDKGIAAARRDYHRPNQKDKLEGSIAGFEACRGKSGFELKELLEVSEIARRDATQHNRERYWWYRCYQLEVEWVCNCVSVMLANAGLPTIVPPTGRALMTCAEIVGVGGQLYGNGASTEPGRSDA